VIIPKRNRLPVFRQIHKHNDQDKLVFVVMLKIEFQFFTHKKNPCQTTKAYPSVRSYDSAMQQAGDFFNIFITGKQRKDKKVFIFVARNVPT
jgi:hypothetical protein